jgi:hypothetical protein
MPIIRVYLSIEARVEAENPGDALHDVQTLVKNQLSKIPEQVFKWRLRVLSGEMLEKREAL